jgi:hypothetical protein
MQRHAGDQGVDERGPNHPAPTLPQDEPTPAAAPGVLAIVDGIRDGCDTDEEPLATGSLVWNVLWAYCRWTGGKGVRAVSGR